MSTVLRCEPGSGTPERPFCSMIGRHATMTSLFEAMRRAAVARAPVLIEGPTGVGKELVAQGVHALSGVPGPLVALNVACLPDTLVESELFGAVRGAYTGSTGDRDGVIASAAGGTLFLDEAGDLTAAVQAKLLRTLESGLYRPVGASRERRTSFRLLMTVQESPRHLLATKRWRPDFYYRTAGIVLTVPALRARRSDIALLASHLLASMGAAPLPVAALRPLAGYAWPGNVRQLKRAVERAVFGAGGGVTAAAILAAARDMDPEWQSGAGEPVDEPGTLRDHERSRIVQMLASTTSAREAAVALGLSIHQLYRRVHRHGIALPQVGRDSRKRD